VPQSSAALTGKAQVLPDPHAPGNAEVQRTRLQDDMTVCIETGICSEMERCAP
jgi:hypothetical protein